MQTDNLSQEGYRCDGSGRGELLARISFFYVVLTFEEPIKLNPKAAAYLRRAI
jgi:hypothetical protein